MFVPFQADLARSIRSFTSGISSSTKSSMIGKKDTERTLYCFYKREHVVARKIDYHVDLSRGHENEFRYVSSQSHYESAGKI